MADANIHAARGVAWREFPLNTGYGLADYLLYIDGEAAGVIEAKKEGATLTGVEVQSARYAQGLPATLPARSVFAFHRPETQAAWLKDLPAAGAKGWESSAAVHTGTATPATVQEGTLIFATNSEAVNAYSTMIATFLCRMQAMPPLIEDGLGPPRSSLSATLRTASRPTNPAP